MTKTLRVAKVLACVFIFYCDSGRSQPPSKPIVSLVVTPEELTIMRKNGSGYFRVDAVASQGFPGSISGTISVSGPSNPSQVQLSDGARGRAFPFTLSAGQKTSETEPPQTGQFAVRTAAQNPTDGTLVYSVTITPSVQYRIDNDVKQVRVKVVPGTGEP